MAKLLVIVLVLLAATVGCLHLVPAPALEPEKEQPPARGIRTVLTISRPLEGERFVNGEAVEFAVTSHASSGVSESKLQWKSSVDGNLGTGSKIQVTKLSVGSHEIQIGDGGNKASINIHVYSDLWELYHSSPSVAENNRVLSDFNIRWVNGNSQDEKWESYGQFKFDQHSANPSKTVPLARLDILRRQRFSQPLPFANGKTAYDHLRDYVKTLNIRLDCDINTAGGNAINLNRNFSVWDTRQSGSQDKPDACKSMLSASSGVAPYIHSLYLLLHEGRHCEPNEPGHSTCSGMSNMDQTLEPGSGHARAALYLLWIYKYGLYDPPSIKQEAKTIAKNLLESRFCTKPAYSDPKVQLVLNELLP